MASPHAAGVAALIVQAHGKGNKAHGYSLDPDTVKSILLGSATDHACPAGGTEIYTDEGRQAEFNAVCDGTTANNGLYGEGIVNAAAAVFKHYRHDRARGRSPPRRWPPRAAGAVRRRPPSAACCECRP